MGKSTIKQRLMADSIFLHLSSPYTQKRFICLCNNKSQESPTANKMMIKSLVYITVCVFCVLTSHKDIDKCKLLDVTSICNMSPKLKLLIYERVWILFTSMEYRTHLIRTLAGLEMFIRCPCQSDWKRKIAAAVITIPNRKTSISTCWLNRLTNLQYAALNYQEPVWNEKKKNKFSKHFRVETSINSTRHYRILQSDRCAFLALSWVTWALDQ